MNMKNLILFFSIAILLTACGTSSDPIKIAEEFTTAYLNADYDKCNKMMEDEEFTPSKEMSSMEKAVVRAIKEEAKKMEYIFTVDKESTSVSEGGADIWFDVTSGSDPDFKDLFKVELEKDDDTGKWYVDSYKSF
ncbi:hypothetical protein [Proteiniphilum sp. UBA5384]|uniref:hypothetical protein n=1 Tax=Proteiniphilum sp. UBA5384 TaxID=1947279 RepID=UPI0025F5CD66|nr:hypothetical protein [Proteiniphilum sp. UBA5384]